jgi:stage II sporulation protein D
MAGARWAWLRAVKPFKQVGWTSLVVGFSLLGGVPTEAASTIRVALSEGRSQLRLGASTDSVIKDGKGRVLGKLPAQAGAYAQPAGAGVQVGRWQAAQLWLEPVGDGLAWVGDRWYRGRVQLVPSEKGLVAVNHVGLEEYLYSVVGGEAIASWPLEALKAQAVAARSFALYRLKRSRDPLYDVGTTTKWQVYKGVEVEAPSTIQAVQATKGQVLTFEDQVIEAVFHSSSGGHTENVEDVWKKPLPYLRGVADFDQAAPVFRWSKVLTAAELRQRIPGIGNIVAFQPLELTPRGRVREIRIVGDAGQKTLTGDRLRSVLDLRSTLFTAEPVSGVLSFLTPQNDPPAQFDIEGRGYGHGLGLSQWGAFGMASQGSDYRNILKHFYQGVLLANQD